MDTLLAFEICQYLIDSCLYLQYRTASLRQSSLKFPLDLPMQNYERVSFTTYLHFAGEGCGINK